MISDFYKSTVERLKERTKNPFDFKNVNPFAGAYLIAFVFHNWEIIYSLFTFDWDESRKTRIDFIKTYLSEHSFFSVFLFPVLSAILAIVAFYIFGIIASAIVVFFNNVLKPIVLTIIHERGPVKSKEDYDEVVKLNKRLINITEEKGNEIVLLNSEFEKKQIRLNELLSEEKKRKESAIEQKNSSEIQVRSVQLELTYCENQKKKLDRIVKLLSHMPDEILMARDYIPVCYAKSMSETQTLFFTEKYWHLSFWVDLSEINLKNEKDGLFFSIEPMTEQTFKILDYSSTGYSKPKIRNQSATISSFTNSLSTNNRRSILNLSFTRIQRKAILNVKSPTDNLSGQSVYTFDDKTFFNVQISYSSNDSGVEIVFYLDGIQLFKTNVLEDFAWEAKFLSQDLDPHQAKFFRILAYNDTRSKEKILSEILANIH